MRNQRIREQGNDPRDDALSQLLLSAYEVQEAPRLSMDRRRAVLDAATRPRRRFSLPVLALRKGWALAGAAALVAVVVAPIALRPDGRTVEAPQVLSAATEVQGLQVTSENGKVVLRWQGQGRPIRVIRATTPDPAAAGGAEQIVVGDSWTDSHTNGAQVVFYRVEALEG